jgi:hypothetical protein
MAAPKRSRFQAQRDQVDIATLYLQGKPQHEIADILSKDQNRGYTLTQQTISRDMKHIERAWRQSSLVEFNTARARELAKIDNLEREYWKAWDRSKTEKKHSEKEKTEGEHVKEVTRIQKWELIGDHRFLEGVQWCISKRCELLGLDAPLQLQHSGLIQVEDITTQKSKEIKSELIDILTRNGIALGGHSEDAGEASRQGAPAAKGTRKTGKV